MTAGNRAFLDEHKPWRDAPRPGPTVVVDVDGPLADAAAFEHLVAAPRAVERDWTSFHAHLGRAALNRAGGRMVRELHRAGYTIVYSTTRPDTLARTTDLWIRHKSLPPGRIEVRSFWHDGTVRPAWEIKRRHWWHLYDEYRHTNPIVAWIDDDPEAVAMLRTQGVPAWESTELLAHHHAGELRPVIDQGPCPPDELDAARIAARPVFDADEQCRQPTRERWQQRHLARMRHRRLEQRTRGQS